MKSAVNNTGLEILRSHLNHCIVDAVKHDDMKHIEELNEAIDRFVK